MNSDGQGRGNSMMSEEDEEPKVRRKREEYYLRTQRKPRFTPRLHSKGADNNRFAHVDDKQTWGKDV